MASRKRAADPPPPTGWRARIDQSLLVVRTAPPTLKLLWRAAPAALVVMLLLTLAQAVVPAAIAWVAKQIVDGVVAAQAGDAQAAHAVSLAVAIELALVVTQAIVTQTQAVVREHIAARLKRLLTVQVIEKALALELRHFEDADLYDKMQNARREADRRPLSLALALLGVLENVVTLITWGALIASTAMWALPVLCIAAIPAFVAELKFANETFSVLTWRAPEGRRLNYLEWVLTRDSTVKEVKVFGLGRFFLDRFTTLFDTMVVQDQRLARRRAAWLGAFGIVALVAFYGCYLVVARRAASGGMTLGELTLALAAFRQAQKSFQAILSGIGDMVEDALFMSNLFAYLDVDAPGERPRGEPVVLPAGPQTIELDHVSFAYAGSSTPVLNNISLTIAPGEKVALVGENGAGKSTLVKLLLRLYEPTSGVIRIGGVDLRDVEPTALRSRFGAVFQDFVRYQLIVRENVGVGDVARRDELPAITAAVEKAGAAGVVDTAGGYDSMLGGWFEEGRELSGGQWQKLALARGFMRDAADVLILDEPTAAVDARAEAELFARIQDLARDKTAILISHRFSTVRMADRILVLEGGRIVEEGSHDALVAQQGRYAQLFALQAQGYR